LTFALSDAPTLLNDLALETIDLLEASQVIDHFVYGDTKPFPAFLGPIFTTQNP